MMSLMSCSESVQRLLWLTVYFPSLCPSLYLCRRPASASTKSNGVVGDCKVPCGQNLWYRALRRSCAMVPSTCPSGSWTPKIAVCSASGTGWTGAIVKVPVGRISRSRLTVQPVLIWICDPSSGSIVSKSFAGQAFGSKKD